MTSIRNGTETFDLTSALEPSGEQLQAFMEGFGEIGRCSMANEKAAFNRMIQEALN